MLIKWKWILFSLIVIGILIASGEIYLQQRDYETNNFEDDLLIKIETLEIQNEYILEGIENINSHIRNINEDISMMEKPYSNEFIFMSEIVERFAKNQDYSSRYNVDGSENKVFYNCENYSRDLAFVGKVLGVDISVYGGKGYNKTIGHKWNKYCFDLEPQTGELVDFSEKYPEIFKEYKND